MSASALRHRPLCDIAREVQEVWPKVHYAAVPYLDALLSLDQVSENYYCDSGKSVVLYFLSNARSWRGADATRIKAELKEIAK
jgi:hypothetical protein